MIQESFVGRLFYLTPPLITAIMGIMMLTFFMQDKLMDSKYPVIDRVDQVVNLFNITSDQVPGRVAAIKQKTKDAIQAVIKIPAKERTFENTMQAYDVLANNLSREAAVLYTLLQVSTDAQLRKETQAAFDELSAFSVEEIEYNRDLYRAIKTYSSQTNEPLTDEQRYYITETIDDYHRRGLDLLSEEQDQVKKLVKQIQKVSIQFSTTINNDATKVYLTQEELVGVPDSLLKGLKKDEKGRYILGMDRNTVTTVLENSVLEETRKKVQQAYTNRAYPANMDNLKQMISLRDALAKKLGYESYAAYELSDEMAENPETVEKFLADITQRSLFKANQEIARYTKELPEGVVLVDGKIKPWDHKYIKAAYKKKHHNFDEQEVRQYFPLESTIVGLLSIYQEFLGITFTQEPVSGLWHPDVRLIKVTSADGTILGYLLLDLFPRDNKYSHACEITLVRAVKPVSTKPQLPGVAVVIANFTKPTPDTPSLLRHEEVKTFFHEFGHALHALLGATTVAQFSGTEVKRDFVEMPSQMLEGWMWDKDIITRISRHYQTGKPMPEKLIDKLVELKNHDEGDDVRGQLIYAYESLRLYGPGAEKDTHGIDMALTRQIRPYIFPDEESHIEMAFGHLSGYGARYYGYLWSKVYALDLFYYIKERGLLNTEVGKRYANTILARGGSRPPQQLLREFLGREPNSNAFFKDLGI